ncbi:MAG: pyridoxine 5'-phosphate synthase [Bacteroidota bacterium]
MSVHTRLSVNLNKVALVRNSRGANRPNLLQVAKDCEAYGAEGITVHPRPDERHVRRADIGLLKSVVGTEFNVEGYPSDAFMQMVVEHKPHQVTLVPDEPGQLTSDHGWDTLRKADFLKEIIETLRNAGIRSSIFVDTDLAMIEGAKEVGVDRIELYTGPYALDFHQDPSAAVAPYTKAAELANELGLGINAGHDLDLDNLAFFKQHVPALLEVSIGHALICDALYLGLSNTIQQYLRCLK